MTTLSDTLEIRDILDIKLVNNDALLIDKIISYYTDTCHNCEAKGINFVEKDVYDEIGYNDEIGDDNIIYFCQDCENKMSCSACGNFCPSFVINEGNCGEYDVDGDMRDCDNCSNVFCEDCSCMGEIFWCNSCEECHCCRPMYKMGDEWTCNKPIEYRGFGCNH